ARVPQNSAPAASNKPTSYTGSDTFTASPSGFYTLPPGPYQYAATAGAFTFGGIWNNTVGDGTLSMYFNQTAHNTGGGVANGWCLNFTINPPVLQIQKSHTGNFRQGDTGATYSITVTNAGPGPTGGTVTVTDSLASAPGLTITNMSGG